MASRRITCSSCNHSFVLTASSRTSQTKCPECGEIVEVAAPSTGNASSRKDSTRQVESRSNAQANPARSGARATHKSAGERAKGVTPSAARQAARSLDHEQKTTKGPMPLVLGGVGVVVLALGSWFFVFRGKGEAPTTSAAESIAGIALSRVADGATLEGPTAKEWAAMNELMTRYRTPPFGSTSVQSGDRLMNKGKQAVPAILNGFKRVDLTTKDGAEIGWKIQTLLLQGLCGDTNFGWRRETRPADVRFNQEVIQRWFDAWEAAGTDDEAWGEIARLKSIPPGLAKPKQGESGK